MSRVRLIETTVLVLAGLLLATATANDVVRQTHVNQRLIADLRTWRTSTGHDYHNLTIEQTVFGERNQTEVVCGNTSPGAPKTRIQICLAIGGPVVGGRRTVGGGWYLPAKTEEDLSRKRYGCFGSAAAGRCPASRAGTGGVLEPAQPSSGRTGSGR
jgi:cell division protein FtsL